MENTPITFFISYAHEDKEYKDTLLKFLKPQIRNKSIAVCTDDGIIAGMEWDDEIKTGLQKSDVVLYLVSADFLASDYINDVEIKKTLDAAKNKEKVIVPVLLRDCDLNSQIIDNDPTSKLSRYQGLPSNFKPINEWEFPDKAWMSVIDGLKSLVTYLKTKK